MIMDIRYNIQFFSNWHCGSGLAAGADVDALVVKESNGLPYVPGRTLKGLLREAAVELNPDKEKRTLLNKIFGSVDEDGTTRMGAAFFGNATLAGGADIVKKGYTPYLFQTFASTAIDETTGIARDNTLRKIETVIPCTLSGDILNLPEGGDALLREAMQMVKRMGVGRHRGYGRCSISITKTEEKKEEEK